MVNDRTWGSRIFDYCLYFGMVIISLVSVAPLAHTIAIAFSDAAQANAGFVTFWPKGFTLDAFAKVMEDKQFFVSTWVSIKRVFIGVSLSVLNSLLMAFPLSREVEDFKGRNIVMWFMIFVMLFNGGLIPTYLAITSYGLVNSFWVLILPGLGNVFNCILVMNFIRNLPKELDDCSNMDGAGPWTKLVYVYAPMCLPVLATITLFRIVAVWNEYFQAMIYITDRSILPLQTYLQQMVVEIDPTTQTTEEMAALSDLTGVTLPSAKLVLSIIPIILIYPLLQGYFISGITVGSVKE
ncbi:carbohydrate ABC transporter permease [Paenibacillus sp. YN15]|uniref:carbohydrate ABC transporter permease n=1 Tax=Paenibacillus sp. YN15 TaxID=1742774 RepID=UPI000DCB597B|nr:carbohydrate ABC transporter permease [Paenibacillus sp. YN15]RAV05502.1 carbohydrate ABC transporter permease [Paenibacillus sp. YN15]